MARQIEALTMTQHTPAPWTILRYGDGTQLVLHQGRTENRICFMATPGSMGDPAKIAADARLIAAAPKMLAALKSIKQATIDGRVCDDVAWYDEITTLHDFCDEVIALAEESADGVSEKPTEGE